MMQPFEGKTPEQLIIPPLDTDQCLGCAWEKYTPEMLERREGVRTKFGTMRYAAYCAKCSEGWSDHDILPGFVLSQKSFNVEKLKDELVDSTVILLEEEYVRGIKRGLTDGILISVGLAFIIYMILQFV
jgi:hypothetical protein